VHPLRPEDRLVSATGVKHALQRSLILEEIDGKIFNSMTAQL
jgi:hypothetical protein